MKIENLGNGYMVLGTVNIAAARASATWPGPLRFACPTFYKGVGSVWLTDDPGGTWTK